MNMTLTVDESQNSTQENPGMQLARVREKKGYSREYVAGKLHLRVKIIELLESDEYEQMPEPVFIKGYLRAYAKLLGVPSEPLLETFNSLYSTERKLDKTLWQSKRESHRGERLVRWLTAVVAVGAIVAISVWWQKNKDNQQFLTAKNTQADVSSAKAEADIRLTDLSKMRSMSTTVQTMPVEMRGG